MFDDTSEIALTIFLKSGGRSVLVRWPTDEEWAARAAKRAAVFHNLGRGKSETVMPEPGEADVALYQKIALNGTPTVTKGEAYQIAETLATAAVLGVEVEGDRATVRLNVLTGEVKHTLDIPSIDQVLAFKRAAYRSIELPYGTREWRLRPDLGARLWDECRGASTDYAGAVPSIHKDAAARAAVEYLERMMGPQRDDANF